MGNGIHTRGGGDNGRIFNVIRLLNEISVKNSPKKYGSFIAQSKKHKSKKRKQRGK